MNKQQKIEAFSMLLDGSTYDEIGKRFGVSKQYISGLFNDITKVSRSVRLTSGCIYPNLAEKIKYGKFSGVKLFEKLHPEKKFAKHYMSHYLKMRLTGKKEFSAWEWTKLSEIFGEPVEKLMVGCQENLTSKEEKQDEKL